MVEEFVGTGPQLEESPMMKVSGLVASYFHYTSFYFDLNFHPRVRFSILV